MTTTTDRSVSKVPEVTLLFWIIKIAATTLGETGGDALSMSMNLGYLVATGIFLVIFLLAVAAQIASKRFYPFLYWTTIIATTTVGTTLADFADRSLGIGYAGGSSLLLALLLASLTVWYRTLGSVSVDTVSSPRVEMILLSHDHVFTTQAPRSGLDRGQRRSRLPQARCFRRVCSLTAAAYFWLNVRPTCSGSHSFSRGWGAVLGRFLDKPLDTGAGAQPLRRHGVAHLMWPASGFPRERRRS
jgi:uncharacterized membrane-anchored protein